jgi:hypothetical protein
MSGFDDLARNLASPMPRKRVFRLAVGALVAVALPAGRATAGSTSGERAWRTAGCGKDGGGIPCAEQFGKLVSECCGPIDKTNPDSNYTCCPPGECWHHGSGKTSVTTCCPEAYRCSKRCCSEGEKCVDGECTRCPDDRLCGNDCCAPSQDCANRKLSLCCVKTWRKCDLGSGVVKCCPPTDTCCYNKKTNTAMCCDAKHPCVDGKCTCPKGQVHCADGRCCDKGQCCGTTCCRKGEFCASSIAYSKPKVCCTSNRIIVSPSGKPVCCPLGTVPNSDDTGCCPAGNPNCCSGEDDGDALECLGNRMCVRGVCQNVS